MAKSAIRKDNLLALPAGLVAWTLAVGGPGCGRKPAPTVAPAEEASSVPAAAEPSPAQSDASPPAPIDGGAVAPASALTHVTAAELRTRIAASRKRATLVNAWASWCGPCRRELPMLQALSINMKPQGVEIVLVSVDEPKDEPKAISYLRDNGITLKSYVVEGSIADFKVGVNPAWPGMLPASFLFDAGARLVHFWGGEAFEHELTPVIEAFLAGKPIEAETRYGLAPGKLE
jgi:thiol-disulfide isomerase/thioredoxin